VALGVLVVAICSLRIAALVFLLAAQAKLSRVRNAAPGLVLWPFFVSGAVVCAAAEASLLVDESRFRESIAEASESPMARARSWSASGSSLVYRPEFGITATD
jgi:hypothetical protein